MRHPHAKLVATLAFALASAGALAYEVDNFTDRSTLTQDALPVLDAKVNHILERAVRDANEDSPDRCNRVILRQELVRWVGPDPVSVLELWATVTDDVQRTHVGFKESIYSDASFRESLGMRIAGIGRSFKLAGHIVGTDKLGHFFMQGLEIFKRVDRDGADLNHVLEFEHGEDGVYGLTMTGVKSYADMAANYQGYKFWSNLYEGEAPYVRCVDNKRWVIQRSFSWKDYVSDAWDEALNCSEMRRSLASKVRTSLKRLGMHCPLDPKPCFDIAKLDKSEFYMSPVCRAIVHGDLGPASQGPVDAAD